MSFGGKPKVTTPAAPPPPPDEDVKTVAPASDKSALDDPKRKGTRSLRIDRTSTADNSGAGLNLPL